MLFLGFISGKRIRFPRKWAKTLKNPGSLTSTQNLAKSWTHVFVHVAPASSSASKKSLHETSCARRRNVRLSVDTVYTNLMTTRYSACHDYTGGWPNVQKNIRHPLRSAGNEIEQFWHMESIYIWLVQKQFSWSKIREVYTILSSSRIWDFDGISPSRSVVQTRRILWWEAFKTSSCRRLLKQVDDQCFQNKWVANAFNTSGGQLGGQCFSY